MQFISNKLSPSSSPHGQLREIAFLFLNRGPHFFETSTRLFVEPYGQSNLSPSIFSLGKSIDLLDLFNLQTCLLFFLKTMKLYKGICFA